MKTKVLADEDGSAESTLKTEALVEYKEYTTRLREWLYRRRHKWSTNGLEGLTATMSALVEEYGLKGLATITGDLVENSVKPMRLRERRL